MEPDELITVRVQYLVDSDPFNSLSMYPIPSRAPVFSFASAVPLATQLGALLRHLGAPQRTGRSEPGRVLSRASRVKRKFGGVDQRACRVVLGGPEKPANVPTEMRYR
uniref:FHOD1 N-terminal GTPase-binding domain-containing protein n=1 Tax=Anopheles dirus TaxID=7168 RepID=A0A182NNK2_9DIPT